MRIAVIGTRGIPGIPGGIETHCMELYPRIAAMGHQVTVYRRKPYTAADGMREYKGVRLVDLPAPRIKSTEAIAHTFLAIMAAKLQKAEILHIHGIGPSILAPLGRLAGMKVVVTNHGADYRRKKWNAFARFILKTGEKLGSRYAHRIIAISNEGAELIKTKYGRSDVRLIYNGVNKITPSSSADYLSSLGLERRKYILGVGRLVAEKGFHELIEAWSGLTDKMGHKVVIAGDADHEDRYSRSLKADAEDAGIIMPGFVKGENLATLLNNAALFVMPSSHEGLPIALLEAMSHGIDVLTSDIPACMLPQLNASDHYRQGDSIDLRRMIMQKLTRPVDKRIYDLKAYDWNSIVEKTEAIYRELEKA